MTAVSPTTVRGVPGMRLEAGDYAATFLPALGMLGVSFEHRGDELLALPGGLDAYRDGRTTGLPMLHPWANRLAGTEYRAAGQSVAFDLAAVHTDAAGLPIHGTMHAHPEWRLVLVQAAERAAVLRARFDFGAHPDLLATFPFPHTLDVEVKLAETGLAVATTLRPTSRRRVPVSFGYHPWFHLPGTRRSQVLLDLPTCTAVELDARGLPTGAVHPSAAEIVPLADHHLDHLYQLGSDRRVAVSGGGRRLVVQLEKGYSYLQVYAPASENVVCLEPMTAPTNALVTGGCPEVKAGNSYLARFSIRVEDEA